MSDTRCNGRFSGFAALPVTFTSTFAGRLARTLGERRPLATALVLFALAFFTTRVADFLGEAAFFFFAIFLVFAMKSIRQYKHVQKQPRHSEAAFYYLLRARTTLYFICAYVGAL